MRAASTTAVSLADLPSAGTALAAVDGRSNIFEMSQTAEDAVLRPNEIGAFPHTVRAGLAERIARHAGDDALARHYALGQGDAEPPLSVDQALWTKVLAFVDKAGNTPRSVTGADIAELQAGGLADADIVRLCELIAFVAYQLRVVAGLRLMGQSA